MNSVVMSDENSLSVPNTLNVDPAVSGKQTLPPLESEFEGVRPPPEITTGALEMSNVDTRPTEEQPDLSKTGDETEEREGALREEESAMIEPQGTTDANSNVEEAQPELLAANDSAENKDNIVPKEDSGVYGKEDVVTPPATSHHKCHLPFWPKWHPFEGGRFPFLNCGPPIFWWFFWIRSMYTYPFQWRFFGFNVTIGEVVIVWPLVIGCFGAMCAANSSVDGTGGMATLWMAFTYATVCRNSLWTFLIGIPFERALYYHKLCGIVTVVFGLWHGVLGTLDNERLFTGWVLQGSMMLLIVLSYAPIRRRFFEFFLISHYILFSVAFVIAIPHGAGGHLFGSLFFVADFVFRNLWQALIWHPKMAYIEALPGGVIRLSFKRPLRWAYNAGQYIFICIPRLTPFETHPFSISSCPDDDYVCIHIRVLGNWTRRLYKLAKKPTKSGKPRKVFMFFEGPYGEPSVSIEGGRYDMVLLISGGIGITPMQSICNDLLNQEKRGRNFKKIWFVWSVRDAAMIDAMYDPSTSQGSQAPAAIRYTPKYQEYQDRRNSRIVQRVDEEIAEELEGKENLSKEEIQREFLLRRAYEVNKSHLRAPISFQPDLLARHGYSREVWADADNENLDDEAVLDRKLNELFDEYKKLEQSYTEEQKLQDGVFRLKMASRQNSRERDTRSAPAAVGAPLQSAWGATDASGKALWAEGGGDTLDIAGDQVEPSATGDEITTAPYTPEDVMPVESAVQDESNANNYSVVENEQEKPVYDVQAGNVESAVAENSSAPSKPKNKVHPLPDLATVVEKKVEMEENDDFLHVEYYLTRLRDGDLEKKMANIDPKVQKVLRYGRPNMPKIFDEMERLAKKKGARKVAVLCCGPAAMVSETRKLCWKHSWKQAQIGCGWGVRFDHHGEVFDF